MLICLQAPVPAVTAAAADRSLVGVALPYGVAGRTSAGTVTVDAGAVAIPADLRRVKLFRDHGRTTPVGYTTAADDSDQALRMTFHAAATPDGDVALLEAAEGIRDCLSVELDDVVIRAGHVTSATLTAVALVPIPAFTGADLAAADTPEVPGMTAPAPAQPQQPQQPQPTEPAQPQQPQPQQPQQPAPSPAPANVPQQQPAPVPNTLQAAQVPAELVSRRPATLTAAQGIAQMSQVIRGSVDASQVNAALADIVPANDTGFGFLQPQWLGELWTPVAVRRDYIESITRATLTSGTKVYGWKWEEYPEVDDYAGNKTAIPTNTVKIVPAEAPIQRLAGGWDVDRLFVDLGENGFLEALFRAATWDYSQKSEDRVAAALLDAATVAAETATDLVDALNLVALYLTRIGSSASFIGISADLWSSLLSMSASDAPWWMAKQSSLALTTADASVADLRVFADHSLPAGTVLGGARQAATFYEASPAPLRVQAVNIPNGGIDIAVFGYQATLVNDARGIVRVNVGVAAPAELTSGGGSGTKTAPKVTR